MKKIMPYVKDFLQRADMLLFTLCFICSVFGIVMIASAMDTAPSGSFRYVAVQILALLIGIVLFVILTVLDIDLLADKWILLGALSVCQIVDPLLTVRMGIDQSLLDAYEVKLP